MEIVLLFIIPIAAFIVLVIILLSLYHFIIFPYRTKMWRKRIRKGDLCRFYQFEEKHTGRIEQVFGQNVSISFLNERNQVTSSISLITNIYPTW